MSGPLKVFVSHAWSESSHYDHFVTLLDEAFGADGWLNKSIRRSEAIDVLRPQHEAAKSTIKHLENELWRARAILPTLPDVVARYVLDKDGEFRVQPTAYDMKCKIIDLEEQLFAARQASPEVVGENIDYWPGKEASKLSELYPVLSDAIRARLFEADVVFVLLSSMASFHEWIRYEVSVGTSRTPSVGVKLPTHSPSPYFDPGCDMMIDPVAVDIHSAIRRLSATR